MNAESLDVLENWPSDWPTHATKETLRVTLELSNQYLEAVIYHGNLTPDEDEHYSIQELFRAARDHYEILKEHHGLDATCKLLEEYHK
jgi:hypothetical protein